MSDTGLSFPDQPRVELDRRLSDLVDAANEVLATQGRLRALLRANQTITAQLDLDSVLRSVVDAARQLTGARYGALGVIGEHGDLERFVHAGMDADEVARIGHLPRGRGLLGALIRDPRPIRITDIAADPRSVGFPDGHPPMHDFLGVPVPVRGAIYGNLYLTGHPSGAFTEEDEQLVRSLATTAGFAVENARLYRETRRRQQWASASAELTARLLTADDETALALAARRMRTLADADGAYVLVLDEAGTEYTVVDVEGADPNHASGSKCPMAGSLVEWVIERDQPARFDEEQLRELDRPFTAFFGPLLAIPLRAPRHTFGVLIVARAAGRHPFSDDELEVAADFAGRASAAVELHEARKDADRMLLFEDRGRIARDLHDRVIQQLFATGMQLQGVLGVLPPGPSVDRVDAAITSLDDSITQIRRIIFTLQATGRGAERGSGRQRLFDLIEERSTALSIEPAVTVTGPIDAVLDGDLAEDVLAVVGEGIANAVKHAGVTEVAVGVAVDARGVTVSITNAGLPLAESGRVSGLGNLRERATRRGGELALSAVDGRTVLRWSVPLRPRGGAVTTSTSTSASA